MEIYEGESRMNIFFDLDGTLIDARQRLYKLFQHLVPGSLLSFNEYWDLKRDKISHKEILTTKFQYADKDIENFQHDWMNSIELKEWLMLDKPIEGVTDRLKELSKTDSLFVVTHRQSTEAVHDQLEGYGWKGLFADIFVTNQKAEKYELIRNVPGIDPKDWFIGDTGNDIQTGKKLGVRTVAVLSGFLSRKRLMEYQPDMIENSVPDIKFTSQ